MCDWNLIVFTTGCELYEYRHWQNCEFLSKFSSVLITSVRLKFNCIYYRLWTLWVQTLTELWISVQVFISFGVFHFKLQSLFIFCINRYTHKVYCTWFLDLSIVNWIFKQKKTKFFIVCHRLVYHFLLVYVLLCF